MNVRTHLKSPRFELLVPGMIDSPICLVTNPTIAGTGPDGLLMMEWNTRKQADAWAKKNPDQIDGKGYLKCTHDYAGNPL